MAVTVSVNDVPAVGVDVDGETVKWSRQATAAMAATAPKMQAATRNWARRIHPLDADEERFIAAPHPLSTWPSGRDQPTVTEILGEAFLQASWDEPTLLISTVVVPVM